MAKYFISAILPGQKQLGAMQFEASSDEACKKKAETLCPSRAVFRSYQVEEFDDLPIDEFISSEKLKALGY